MADAGESLFAVLLELTNVFEVEGRESEHDGLLLKVALLPQELELGVSSIPSQHAAWRMFYCNFSVLPHSLRLHRLHIRLRGG